MLILLWTLLLLVQASLQTTIGNRELVGSTGCIGIPAIPEIVPPATKPKPVFVKAEDAYKCLTSIPLNKANSIKTIDQLKKVLAFQSSLAYSKNPPKQAKVDIEPVDVIGVLDGIKKSVQNNVDTNNYQFDFAVREALRRTRESHLWFSPYCLGGLFLFQHNLRLVSFADTPNGSPKVYNMEDVKKTKASDPLPRSITLVNELPVQFYLKAYADREDGKYHDPDVRWNALLNNRQGGNYNQGYFSSSRTYQGTFFTITYDDGTTERIEWYASAKLKKTVTFSENLYFQECVAPPAPKKRDDGEAQEEPELLPVETTPYNPFATSGAPTSTAAIASPSQTAFSLTGSVPAKLSLPSLPPMDAYSPKYRIFRTELSALASSYIVDMPNKKKFGVLALHSFSSQRTAEIKNKVLTNLNKPLTNGDVEQEFMNLVKDSIKRFQKDGVTRVVIDVTGNGGGTIGLGYDVAKQLFPNHKPYAGTNMQATPALKVFFTYLKGNTKSSYNFESDDQRLSDGVTKFKSAEYIYGPIKGYLSNSFTQLIRREPKFMINKPTVVSGAPPFQAQNVVILTDGRCGSTCTLMSEALKEVKVRTVVYGGLSPAQTPMQAIAGTEGSQVYKFEEYIRDVDYIRKTYPKAAQTYKDLLPGPFPLRGIDEENLGSINMRNAIRKGEPIPLAYLYEKADFHFQMTIGMVSDAAEIWKETYRRVWG